MNLDPEIDLLAILRKSLDQALFLYIFIHELRLRGVRASVTIVQIRNFTKCNEISFDPDSFLESLKGLFGKCWRGVAMACKIAHSILVHDLLATEIKIHF